MMYKVFVLEKCSPRSPNYRPGSAPVLPDLILDLTGISDSDRLEN